MGAGTRIREIRESFGLGRKEFADQIGLSKRTLEQIEMERQRATEDALRAISNQWPQYIHWVLTGETSIEHGQTSPETEKIREDSKRVGEAS